MRERVRGPERPVSTAQTDFLMRKCVDGRLDGWNSDPGALRFMAAE